ncbi:MAG: DnaD domain protein [Lachnospiraceae bacterium]|nr:DnaD domain protein [Lachnospiraceae bacterium]
MSQFILQSKSGGFIVLSNRFIDEYMPHADGEYVKVYLYLLRQAAAECPALSLSDIAEHLEDTEKDIKRAISYWTNIGLLSVRFGADGEIEALMLEDIPAQEKSVQESAARDVQEVAATQRVTEVSTPAKSASATKTPHNYTPQEIAEISENAGLEELYFVISSYLGKPLSQTEISAILFFYDTLGFSTELIEYLFEYCISKNHKSIRYIEKVATNWAAERITTVEQARAQVAGHSEDCYAVLRAFGLSGRKPVPQELAFVNTWQEMYGMSMELILEACARTMNTIHTPSFEYADGILSSWHKQGVKTRADLTAVDESFAAKRQQAERNFTQSAKPAKQKNRFHNFEERSYTDDEEAFERFLLTGQHSQ